MATRQVRRIIEELESVVERTMIKITLDAVANFQEDSPVDTGWLKANFIPNVGVSNYETFGSPEDPSAALSVQKEGLSDVLNYKLRNGQIRISNNVNYIEAVNAKHPTAAGFIERGIEKALTQDLLGIAR